MALYASNSELSSFLQGSSSLYKSIIQSLPFVYENMTVEDVKMVDRYSQPRIAAFLSERRRQYFIVTEHRILCEIPTL